MLNNLPYKSKQFFFVLIKLSIVAGAFYFIFQKLSDTKQLNWIDFIDLLIEKNVFSARNIFFLIMLSMLNWLFEILKWQFLVKTIQPISFKRAMEQSLASHTASLITPNRIGDYGAKMIYFKSEFRTKIVMLNLIGNLSQMTITVIIGVAGLLFLVNQHPITVDYFKIIQLLLFVIVAISLVGYLLRRTPFIIKGFSWAEIKIFFLQLSRKLIQNVLSLSLLRYLIFSFQFYLLLLLFAVELNYYNAMIIISSMYLLVSVIPMLFIFDVVVKGGIALFLFEFAGVDALIILSVITLMWLLNVVVPAVFGSFYVLNFNVVKPSEL
ncbi:hypothetical protein [Paucihalobacter sp.]|uniref:hypothetical protein n=1 Tax=Paucihalobacter sp. TaxID=2850405 RepID=UPI002FE36075